MRSGDIREMFISYFGERGHTEVASSSLIPGNDESLMFTAAGMVQFKDVFLQRVPRPYPRAVSCQRCLRAGGKHNDLDEVGYSPSHHTFFEMLGNFSFGDYFKREAIEFSWELLTRHFQLPPELLHITVYKDDEESAGIWSSVSGRADSAIERRGADENFWAMGDTGPCGPCTEIYYRYGDPDDKLVEIWNLVFTQYNRDSSGRLNPIPSPSVDTGMGLERMAAVMQGVDDNYATDLFLPLVDAVRDMAGEEASNSRVASVRVIADHVRAAAFLVADGIVPSNEGRGYVLRRIVRRALRHACLLGMEQAMLPKLLAPLQQVLADAWPLLVKKEKLIARVLNEEEQRFAGILRQGMQHVDKTLEQVSGNTLPGELIFKLYDTYGFPVDLTADIAHERGLNMDMAGFEAAMAEQKQRARSSSRFHDGDTVTSVDCNTSFTGYDSLVGSGTVVALQKDNNHVKELRQGDKGTVALSSTPFYAEAGGQVGDKGILRGAGVEFTVNDTRLCGNAILHTGKVVTGSISQGVELNAEVNCQHRADTMRNHSATHLLHAALRRHLGEHVCQQGSMVMPDRLRFDFSHGEPVAAKTIAAIESEVNTVILQKHATEIRSMPKQEAMDSGAMSMFGEKYSDPVRVLNIGGGYSRELCGGTHVDNSIDIGMFKIISESGIASGVRRIEAVTGREAVNWVIQLSASMTGMASKLGGGIARIEDNLARLMSHDRELELENRSLRRGMAKLRASQMLDKAVVSIEGNKLVAQCLENNTSVAMMRDIAEMLRDKMSQGMVLLATVSDNSKVQLVAAADKDAPLPATELIADIADKVGGRGGGNATMAQAGGNRPQQLAAAMEGFPDWVRQQLRGS